MSETTIEQTAGHTMPSVRVVPARPLGGLGMSAPLGTVGFAGVTGLRLADVVGAPIATVPPREGPPR